MGAGASSSQGSSKSRRYWFLGTSPSLDDGQLTQSTTESSAHLVTDGVSKRSSIDVQGEIRARVSAIAERNAEGRHIDSPKLSKLQLRKLPNKERILEEMRVQTCTQEFNTTSSMTVRWELLYPGAENQIQFFHVQVLALENDSASSEDLVRASSRLVSSLEDSPDKKVIFKCKLGQWTDVPKDAIDKAKQQIYLGEMNSDKVPGLVFRVRGRHSVGWGSWSASNEPFYPISNVFPQPKVLSVEDEPYFAKVTWPEEPSNNVFGLVLVYKLFARVISSEEQLNKAGSRLTKDAGSNSSSEQKEANESGNEKSGIRKVPDGYFSNERDRIVYEGRGTNAELGCTVAQLVAGSAVDSGLPLSPGSCISLRIECKMGLNRGDKRYNSYFKSRETVFKVPPTVPSTMLAPYVSRVSPQEIILTWDAPPHDGGESVTVFKVLVRTRNSKTGESLDRQAYSGSDYSCKLTGREAVPGIEYGFVVFAINSVGKSIPSERSWVVVPTAAQEEQALKDAEAANAAAKEAAVAAEAVAKARMELEELGLDPDEYAQDLLEQKDDQAGMMASPSALVDLPLGWNEYWDPRTEEMFYYNVFTGENQWEHPGPGSPGTQEANTSQDGQTDEFNDNALQWRLFRKKRFRFLSRLHRRGKTIIAANSSNYNSGGDVIKLIIRRNMLVADSVLKLKRLSSEQLMQRLQVIYEGEEGIDSGGLVKDWFLEVTNELLGPNYCLFMRTECGLYTIDPRSKLQSESKLYYKLFGRLLGKALYDQQMVRAPLCTGILRQMLGPLAGAEQHTSISDLWEVDPVLCKSLNWILENDITDVIDETFTVLVEEFGTKREVELCPCGKDIAVTEGNKSEYVDALVRWRFKGAIKEQLGWFLDGLWEVVPSPTLSAFKTQELSLLLNGKAEIDISAWRAGCVRYTGGYSDESLPVQCFWEAMEQMSHEERGQVIRFATGCDKMPLDGFSPLLPFTLTKSEFGEDGLPTAHTCFNQLVLPPYKTTESLRQKLLMACDYGVGFEMT